MNSIEVFTSLEQAINCLRVNKYDNDKIDLLPQLTKNSLIDVLNDKDNKA